MRSFTRICLSLASVPMMAQSPTMTSTVKDRQNIRLTVYQGGKAFIQETRGLNLQKGSTLVNFEDLASGIDPSTFTIKGLEGSQLSVKRQTYRYARPTAQQLLSRYEGKTVKFASTTGSTEVLEEATLLSGEAGNLVLRFDDRVEVLGVTTLNRLVLPKLPPEVATKPQMETSVELGATGRHALAISYVTSGVQWSPSYSVFIKPGDSALDLTAWAKLINGTATTIEDAQVDLLTGDLPGDGESDVYASLPRADRSLGGVVSNLQFMTPPKPPPPPPPPLFEADSLPSGTNVGEHKVYALPSRLTLLPLQSVQVPFLDVHGVKVKKEYRISQFLLGGNQDSLDGNGSQVSIDTYLTFKNTESEKLGRQLPAGRVRLFQPDEGGVLRYLGDTEIPESVSGMEVRLGLGSASELTAKVRILEQKSDEDASPKRSTQERAVEYLFTNRKGEAQSVHLQVRIPGEWTLISSSLPGTKEQASTLGFQIEVPAKGQTKLQFRVKTRIMGPVY